MFKLLVQGYAAGLFTEGTQIISADVAMASILWQTKIDGNLIDSSVVANILKGVLGLIPSVDWTTPQATKFLTSFVNQPNTLGKNGLGIAGACNNQTDDDGNYLYQGAITVAEPIPLCAGFNFSTFQIDGSNMDNYAAFSYDATYALALAMHEVINNQKLPVSNGDALYAALINNVSFIGATGLVTFAKAKTTDSTKMFQGDRQTGVSYQILNFQPNVYLADNKRNLGFVGVGVWTPENKMKIDSASTIVYNTANGLPATDRPPLIVLTIISEYKNALKGLGIALFALMGFLSIIFGYFRKTKILRSIQLKMQCVIIAGGFIGAARVITGSLPVSHNSCSLNTWFGHLAFWLIFCSMFLKTWRVHKIVNNKTLKRIMIPENQILVFMAMAVIFVLMYLILLEGLPFFRGEKVTSFYDVGLQRYSEDRCVRKILGELSNNLIICMFKYSHVCY